ncbi:MAG: hypothetical protein ABFS21_06710 [Actinomycetota bacterium]
MSDDLSVDDALSMIMSLSREIDSLAPDDHRRSSLEHRRDQLRVAAQSAADSSRSGVALHHELAGLRTRLSEIDGKPIGKGWAEKGHYRWVNDPSAYANNINAMLDEQDAEERAKIISRIKELEQLLDE